ncbi:MAG: PolC-type DNA polymerase III N-terminal domain-containing protein [Lachnospiraceae bacterium]
MAKRFFETFPALILEDELKDLFEFAEVTALKYNRDRTAIHVYLLCRRLISKPQIYAVESKIEKQMFPDGDMKIRIFESFSLSEQYTPSYLVDVYKDSLFAEIKRRSDLDYHILMRADWKVADDDSLLLTLEDSLWARNRAGELREWIQMVFYDRCAISIPVAVSFKERDTTAIEEEKKRAEAQAIARIMKANSVASKEKEDEFMIQPLLIRKRQ